MENNPLKPDRSVYKRKHIVDSLIGEIETGKYGIGALLPSINELKDRFGVSRMTVVKAYDELKSKGVIRSIPYKGFAVVTSKNIVKHRILLFLDALNGYKQVLYESFKEGIGRQGTVDVFFHHFNVTVFENIIAQNLWNYTSFVVLPTMKGNCSQVLKSVPEGKLYLLDYGLHPYGKKYPCVCQNFGEYVVDKLTMLLDRLVKYNRFYFVHPQGSEPDFIRGFFRFCKTHHLYGEWLCNANDCRPLKGECYIINHDEDLLSVLDAAKEANLEIGKDIGILSHNDDPMKRHVANGITVMSTDFRKMGLTMADMVLNHKKDRVENPSYLIIRNSL